MRDREVIKLIEADGWYFAKQNGSHRQFHHPVKPGKTTVPMHGNKDLNIKTIHSILKQAGLR